MVAEIITIGDELLIGQTVDTNSAWMGKSLNSIGVEVNKITTISDEKLEIISTLDEAIKRSDLVLITGGLGPTKDDITKHTLTEYFNTQLILNQEMLDKITEFFEKIGREMIESNVQQAYLPESCEVLINNHGTAAGMLFERNDTIVVSMPGVPHEMKGLMNDYVLPKIKSLNPNVIIHQRNILTQGIGESFLAQIVEEWENSLESEKIKIAYLPSSSQVKIRLTKVGSNLDELKSVVEKKISEFMEKAGEYVYGFDDDTLESVLAKALLKKKATIALAESCTGGNIARVITSMSGSSDYFLGSAVTYSIPSKINLLNIEAELITNNGVVSEEVAKAMANGARLKFNSTFALSTTGYAGSEGEGDIQGGTVCIGISTRNHTFAKTFIFGKNRHSNINRFTRTALNLLIKEILSDKFE